MAGYEVGDLSFQTSKEESRGEDVTYTMFKQSFKGEMLFSVDRLSGIIRTEKVIDREQVCASPFVPPAFRTHISNHPHQPLSEHSMNIPHHQNLHPSNLPFFSEPHYSSSHLDYNNDPPVSVSSFKIHVGEKAFIKKHTARTRRKKRMGTGHSRKNTDIKFLTKRKKLKSRRVIMKKTKNNVEKLRLKNKNSKRTYNKSVYKHKRKVKSKRRGKRQSETHSSHGSSDERCIVNLDVAKKQGKVTSILRMRVLIQDINDNAPFFLNHTASLEISETVQARHNLLIPPAYDLDSGVNALIDFRLEPPNDAFELITTPKADQSVQLRLALKRKLDREVNDFYSFKVRISTVFCR